ncbi:hypothetical protein FB451DRAFT_1401383 [Mycena latifolia]|nr:hypothetical protein FB451DRAFT_1401383 [Mycena latifolia]
MTFLRATTPYIRYLAGQLKPSQRSYLIARAGSYSALYFFIPSLLDRKPDAWLRHLHLSLIDHPVSPVVAHQFHDAPQLRSVVLENPLGECRITVGVADVDNTERRDPCDIALPRLESLTLEDGNSKWAPKQQLRDVFIVPPDPRIIPEARSVEALASFISKAGRTDDHMSCHIVAERSVSIDRAKYRIPGESEVLLRRLA